MLGVCSHRHPVFLALGSAPGRKRLSLVRLHLWETGLSQDETGVKAWAEWTGGLVSRRCPVQPHVYGVGILTKVISSARPLVYPGSTP